MSRKHRLLFVCLGNICRSPLAEHVFRHLTRQRGVADRFEIESCGTGHWHVGCDADPRTIAVARGHGVEIVHCARMLNPAADFVRFDLLLALDRANERTILSRGGPPDRVRLLRSFEPRSDDEPADDRRRDLEVPDPYEGGPEHFEEVFAIVERSCRGLLDRLLAESSGSARQ